MNKPITQLELVPAVLVKAAPEPSDAEIDRLRWSADDPDVIIRHQPQLAVYRNQFDDIVIRRENLIDGTDEDHFVFCRPENLPTLIAALKRHLP